MHIEAQFSAACILALSLGGASACSSQGFDVAESQLPETGSVDDSATEDAPDAPHDSHPETDPPKDGDHHDSGPELDSAPPPDSAPIDTGIGIDSTPPIDTGVMDSGTTDTGAGGEDAITCSRWCAGPGSLPLGSPCSMASDCCSELCEFCPGVGNCCVPQSTASTWCGGKDATPEWCPGVGHCVP